MKQKTFKVKLEPSPSVHADEKVLKGIFTSELKADAAEDVPYDDAGKMENIVTMCLIQTSSLTF